MKRRKDLDRFQAVCDRVFACVFGLAGLSGVAGALLAGAWWHLWTAAACGWLAWLLLREARGLEGRD